MGVDRGLDTYHGESRTLSVGADYLIRESWFSPREQLQTHEHPNGYLCLVLNGSFTESSPGHRDIEVAAGSVYFLPASHRHTNDFAARGARCFRIEVGPMLLSELFEAGTRLTQPFFACGGRVSWSALRTYRRALTHTTTRLDLDELVLDLLANLDGVVRTCRDDAPPWIRRVRERLADNPSETPTLHALASDAGVHAAHLTRAFRQSYGCSIGEFLQTHRVTSACQLLLRTDRSLATIAADLGYFDQSHFTRMFKERTGYTPSAFRHDRAALPKAL